MLSFRSRGRKQKPVEKAKPKKPKDCKRFKVSCAGKTTFLYKFTTGEFVEDKQDLSMRLLNIDGGVLTKVVETDDYCVQLEIHDTAEGERNNNLTQFYYGNTTILLLFFSLTSRDSFEGLEETLSRCYAFGVPQQAVRVLVGTKSDCERQREVEQSEIDEFVEEHGLTYFATSSLSNANIAEVFDYAVSELFRRLDAGRFNGQDELLATMTWAPEREEPDRVTGEGDTTEEGAGSGPSKESQERHSTGNYIQPPKKRCSELSGSDDPKKDRKNSRSTSVGPEKGQKKKKDRRASEKVKRIKSGKNPNEGT